ncbi:hypothetical protein SESBI_50988 [Sesbania bispinosa]|nr:hypothetical protein SESBI_50988 [Sesbania bispinosa]
MPGAKTWNLARVQEVIPIEHIPTVTQTPLCWEGDDDVFYWPHDKSGNYTVRSAYHVSATTRTPVIYLSHKISAMVVSKVRYSTSVDK